MGKNITVVKVNGEKEAFDPNKLRNSLRRSGARDEVTESIVEHIIGELQNGMSTTHIYRHAFSLLRKIEERPVAARYSMRRAVFGLGPSGFPFEDYVSELFRANGYVVETGKIMQGACATHEVDMLAYKDDVFIGAELKFHNSAGIKTDLKTALYVRERFEDLKRAKGNVEGKLPYIEQGMLVTNTKFTRNAISYSKCVGLRLLGWNYPKRGHLEEIIERTGVYPITALTTLTQKEKINLLNQNVIVCNNLDSKMEVLTSAGVPPAKIGTVLEESQALCTLSDYIK
jgi:hypothetical protein